MVYSVSPDDLNDVEVISEQIKIRTTDQSQTKMCVMQ